MRIAIVNDLLLAVEALRRVVAAAPGYDVAWIARDGDEAISKCAMDPPDLILMDLIMPRVDGVEATRQIMNKSPCAILVVTATVSGNISKVYEAMGAGALDAVNTPVLGQGGDVGGADPLLAKIARIGRLIGKVDTAHVFLSRTAKPAGDAELPGLVLLGSSTGGPQVLSEILSHMPANFPAGVLIVQHVDAEFAPGLVQWLDRRTPLRVAVAKDGAMPEAGLVQVAATNDHLEMTRARTLHYTVNPADCPYRPSVDVLFKSVARFWPQPSIAALLTGMGRDGAAGLLELRNRGWQTVAQDEATCIVYGMPKAAVELKAAGKVLPSFEIGPELVRRTKDIHRTNS